MWDAVGMGWWMGQGWGRVGWGRYGLGGGIVGLIWGVVRDGYKVHAKWGDGQVRGVGEQGRRGGAGETPSLPHPPPPTKKLTGRYKNITLHILRKVVGN